MEKTFILPLKKAVNNDSLDQFGYFKIHIDTTGLTTDSKFITMIVNNKNGAAGAYIAEEGKSFKDGTIVIEENTGNQLLIEPDQVFTIMYPKYGSRVFSCVNDANQASQLRISPMAVDLFNLRYMDGSAKRISTFIDLSSRIPHSIKGDFRYYQELCSGYSQVCIQNSDVDFDLSYIHGMTDISSVVLSGNAKAKGDVESFVESISSKTSGTVIIWNSDKKADITIGTGSNKRVFGGYNIKFLTDTVSVASSSGAHETNPYAVYTKANETWTYYI